MNYETWMQAVDNIISKETGLVQAELPDWLSRDAYNSGLTPQEGANECLTSIGFYQEMLVDEL